MNTNKLDKLPTIENYNFDDLIVQSKVVEMMFWIIGLTTLVYIDSVGKGAIAEQTMAFAFGISVLCGLIQFNQLIKIDKVLKGNRMVAAHNEYEAILKLSFIPYSLLYIISIVDVMVGGKA